MVLVYLCDEEGYYKDWTMVNEGEPLPDNSTKLMPPDGMHKPRLINDEWVETLTEEEIAERKKEQPVQLTEEQLRLQTLEQENKLLKVQNKALSERTDFHEELIAEMAMIVYS
jgi:hypothetical protein